MKWVRQRYHVQPASSAAMAAFKPLWASEVTSFTPLNPRATRLRGKRCPSCFVLAGEHVQTEDLSVAVAVHSGSDRSGHAHHPSAFTTTLRDPIEPDERVRNIIQRAVAEALYHRIEFFGQFGDLALAHSFQPEGLDQTVDTARRDTSHVAFGTTWTSARSERRLGASNHSGKYFPLRSLGISKSIVPTRVFHRHLRYPLRRFTRSALGFPYGAPQATLASTDMKTSDTAFTISRRKSVSASSIRWLCQVSCVV